MTIDTTAPRPLTPARLPCNTFSIAETEWMRRHLSAGVDLDVICQEFPDHPRQEVLAKISRLSWRHRHGQ